MSTSQARSQNNNSNDSIAFKRAYNYIRTDSIFEDDEKFTISCLFSGSYYSLFIDEIYEKENRERFYKQAKMKDKANNDKKVAENSLLKKYFTELPLAENKIFFSKLIDNRDLFAEIIQKTETTDSHSKSVYYYFRFDNNFNIDTVYCKTLREGFLAEAGNLE